MKNTEYSPQRKRSEFCLSLCLNDLSQSRQVSGTSLPSFQLLEYFRFFSPYAPQFLFYLEIILFIWSSLDLNWKEKHLHYVKLEAFLGPHGSGGILLE